MYCYSMYMYIDSIFKTACVVCVVASHQFSATALYCASYSGHLQVVRLLLGRGSEVECRQEVRQS